MLRFIFGTATGLIIGFSYGVYKVAEVPESTVVKAVKLLKALKKAVDLLG